MAAKLSRRTLWVSAAALFILFSGAVGAGIYREVDGPQLRDCTREVWDLRRTNQAFDEENRRLAGSIQDLEARIATLEAELKKANSEG